MYLPPIIVFVLASQVPFEPLLRRLARWAGTEWAALCKPIVVLGRKRVASFPCFPLGGQFWDKPKLWAKFALITLHRTSSSDITPLYSPILP